MLAFCKPSGGSFKLSIDPFFIENLRDVVGLYLNPPENIPLSMNADGVCDLMMNGDALITLEGDPQSTTPRINAVVGVLPEADSPQALRLLLQANFNGQGTGANSLAIDHVSNEVVLGRKVDVTTWAPTAS